MTYKNWRCPAEDCGAILTLQTMLQPRMQTEGQWKVEGACPACRRRLAITKQGTWVVAPGRPRDAQPPSKRFRPHGWKPPHGTGTRPHR